MNDKAKSQLTEEDLIIKAFSNLVNRDEFDEYYGIMVKVFLAYSLTIQDLFTNKDDSKVTLQQTLDRFNDDVKSSHKASAEALARMSELFGEMG